jgi:hypothetical protein
VNRLAREVIGAAIEVHPHPGASLLFMGFVMRKNVHGLAVNLDGFCILEETWLA